MSDSQIVAGSKTVSGPAYEPGTFRSSSGVLTGISVDPGAPVTIFDKVHFSKADAAETSNVSGLAVTAGEGDTNITIRYAGPLTLPIAAWDARIEGGSSVGLTPHALYYLSASVAGKITTVRPSTPGDFATPIGFAHNANTLMIQIGTATAVGG